MNYNNRSSAKEFNPIKLNIKSNNKIINWQNIAVCENYLIIKDERIEIFEINLQENSAEYRREIRIGKELEKIIAIDLNNIFFLLSESILKYDILTGKRFSVSFSKFSGSKTTPIQRNQITAIYFNEKIKLSKDDKNFYFGLLTTGENGELHVSKELNKDNFNDTLEIVFESIKSFENEIKHVELKVFYPNDDDKGYYFITVLSHLTGWYSLFRVYSNDYVTFTKELKNAEWKFLYDYSGKISKTCYSIHYDANSAHPISFISMSDKLKLKYVKFNEIHDDEDISSFTREEVEVDFDEEIKNFGDRGYFGTDSLVGVHHHSNMIYVSFKNRIYLYDINTKEIITMKKFDTETLRDIYIENPEFSDEHNFYNLYLLSNRNVYYSKIETDFDADLYRVNSQQNMFVNESYSEENESDIDPKCNYCNQICNKRCSSCKSVYYCNEKHQEFDWQNHRKVCTWKDTNNDEFNENNDNMKEMIVYTPHQWDLERKEILTYFQDTNRNSKTFVKGIDMCYTLIALNREYLSNLNPNTLKNLKSVNTHSKEKGKEDILKNIINLYKLYEDYICNILLLVEGYMLKKSKNEVWRILNKLIKEIEEREILKFIDILTDNLKSYLTHLETIKFLRNESLEKLNLIKNMQEIYIKYLKLISTIGKIYYGIGEFSAYENYIIQYVERLERVFSSSIIKGAITILANAYLLMANLYVELDNLGKAIILYNECLKILPDPKENKQIMDLAIAANYNLGMIYFVADQKQNSINKLEQALKIKVEYRMDSTSEQTAIINETMGEVHLEYKNFSAAYTHLKNAYDIRSKLPNLNDKKSKMKINILLDYIYQNLEKDADKKFNRPPGVGPNHISTREEKDFDELMNYIRSTAEEKNEFRREYDGGKSKPRTDNDIEELEKFFLFMMKLSSLQAHVLNNTQPDIEKNLNMPIFFSSDFKNSLNHHQRLELCNLKLMSLMRNRILKNPKGRIEIENLNYDMIHPKNSQNNLSSIKNFFVVNKIIKNWEITKKHTQADNFMERRISKVDPLNRRGMRDDGMAQQRRMKRTDTKNMQGDMNNINTNIGNMNINTKSNMEGDDNILNQNINQNQMKEYQSISHDQFQSRIRSYCKQNLPNKEQLLDDNILLFFSQNLTNEELHSIYNNPEFVFEIIEEYKTAGLQDDEDENMNKTFDNGMEDNKDEEDPSQYGSEVDSKKDGNKDMSYNPMAKFQF